MLAERYHFRTLARSPSFGVMKVSLLPECHGDDGPAAVAEVRLSGRAVDEVVIVC